MLDVLVIAPHPDDAELGMAGSILQMRREGLQVGILDLTSGEPTPHGDPATRLCETEAATKVLGVTWRENLGLVNREVESTLAARSALANVFRRTRPKHLFTPYWTDAHPDHTAATQLVEQARFWSKLTKSTLEGQPHHPERIFHYYTFHLRQSPRPDFVVDISDVMDGKLEAIRCYQSQFVIGREQEAPSLLERFETFAAYWGDMIGRRYGEPFTCREVVALRSWRDVI